MQNFEHSKGLDVFNLASYSHHIYNISGVGKYTTSTYSRETVRTYPGRVFGMRKESQFNNSGKFVKGSGRLNPVLHLKSEISCTNGDFLLYWLAYGKKICLGGVSGPLALTISNFSTAFPSVPAVEDYLLTNSYAKAYEAKQQVLTTLGELPETLDMFNKPLQQLRRPLKELVPKRPLNPIKALKFASDAWLTARYGIMPLLGEIDGYRELYNKKSTFEPGLIRNASGRSIPLSSTRTEGVRLSDTGYYFSYVEGSSTTIHQSALVYAKKNGSVAAALGLDARGVALALYELTPYSFVLDWFVDVGTWLAASLPSPDVNIVSNCTSAKAEVTDWVHTTDVGVYPNVVETYPRTPVGSTATCKRVAYYRSISSVLPSLPEVNFNFSALSRQLDSLSLSFQQTQRHLPR